MAACQFYRTFTGSAVDLVNRARQGVQAEGGTLTGDATHGTFSITRHVFGIPRTVAGSYAVHGNAIHFDVTRTDLPATCDMVQTKIDGFLKPSTKAVQAT